MVQNKLKSSGCRGQRSPSEAHRQLISKTGCSRTRSRTRHCPKTHCLDLKSNIIGFPIRHYPIQAEALVLRTRKQRVFSSSASPCLILFSYLIQTFLNHLLCSPNAQHHRQMTTTLHPLPHAVRLVTLRYSSTKSRNHRPGKRNASSRARLRVLLTIIADSPAAIRKERADAVEA